MRLSELKNLVDEALLQNGDIEVRSFVYTKMDILDVESFSFEVEDYEDFDGSKAFEVMINLAPLNRYSDNEV